jgi:hypothetical protein
MASGDSDIESVIGNKSSLDADAEIEHLQNDRPFPNVKLPEEETATPKDSKDVSVIIEAEKIRSEW